MSQKPSTDDLQKLHRELERLKFSKLQIENEVERLRAHIQWMETSKFWKLRSLFLKLQQALAFKFSDDVKSGLNTWFDSKVTAVEPDDAELPKSESADSLKTAKALWTRLSQAALNVFLNTNQPLHLPTSLEPEVTIILVLFNRAELTYQCLRSLYELADIPFEVVIVDNASTDATRQLLRKVEGATILLNGLNHHFLAAVNQAAKAAKGKYLLLLNNDAQLLPGSLASAIATLNSAPDIGAVGGKIILPDGSLQEAGSIIWQDGSCFGYGRGDDPCAPMYMFQRDVDYCSGAFLLTPKALFEALDGFDRRYAPAYYEETDYCMRLWQMGKRIVYDPNAVILHYEFASSKTTADAIRLQAERQQILINQHREQLAAHFESSEANRLFARIHPPHPPSVLIIDDRAPNQYFGSGFPRANTLLKGLLKLGYFVTVYPLADLRDTWDTVYTDIPKQVEVILGAKWGLAGLPTFVEQRSQFYDYVLISRPHNMRCMGALLASNPALLPHATIIYDAEALFSIREIAYQALQGAPLTATQQQHLIESEMQLAQKADVVIAVSEMERSRFEQYGYQATQTLGHAIPVSPTLSSFLERSNILFVGSIYDEKSPNADSVIWFTEEILPLIQSAITTDLQFIVAGLNTVERVAKLASEHVILTGKVEDLESFYDSARLFVAPTRFAAGIPHKVHEAAAKGVPVVSTSLIAAQLGWEHNQELLVADTAPDFAAHCTALYQDAELWNRLRRNALARIAEDCSEAKFMATLQAIFPAVKTNHNG